MNNTKLKDRLGSKVQAFAEPVEEAEVVTVSEASLAPVDSSYIALTNNAMEIIKENLKNQPLSVQLFDIVKSPSGGSTVFSVPGLAGDEAEKELTGIILDYTTPRAYWDTPDPVVGQIAELVRNSRDIFLDTFTRIIPFGDFYKKDKAVEIIQSAIAALIEKENATSVNAIPEKKLLLLAQKASNYRRIDNVMKAFAEINVSPITISKRHDVKQLECLYSYLFDKK